MNRKLTEDLHQYFSRKEELTPDENYLLNQLIGELPYFQIITVSRDDLESKGFDVSGVDDCTMTELSRKLKDDYCTQLFWLSMESIAEEYCEIPKYKCPKCGEGASQYNPYEKKCRCFGCNNEWVLTEPTGRYALVKFPIDSSFFEQHNIGYPSYNHDDNGARYVPEHIYKAHFGREPHVHSLFEPIQWPDSQKFFDLKAENESIFELCEPIDADFDALRDFGDTAIWVPICLSTMPN